MVAFFKEFKDISVFFKDLRQKIETLNLRQDPGSTPAFVRDILTICWWQFGNQEIEWLPNWRYQIVVTKLSLDILGTNNLVTIQFLSYQIVVTKMLVTKMLVPKL